MRIGPELLSLDFTQKDGDNNLTMFKLLGFLQKHLELSLRFLGPGLRGRNVMSSNWEEKSVLAGIQSMSVDDRFVVRDAKVLILGLDNSGKISLLHKLRDGGELTVVKPQEIQVSPLSFVLPSFHERAHPLQQLRN